MQECAEIGKVFDVIHVTVNYFNAGAVEAMCREQNVPLELFTGPLTAIGDEVGSISTILRPFAIKDDTFSFGLSYILDEFIHSGKKTLDGFLELFEDSELVFGKFVHILFRHTDEETQKRLIARDHTLWYRVCEEAELPGEVKMGLIYLVTRYEALLPEIRQEIRRIYTAVNSYHNTHRDVVQKTLKILEEPGELDFIAASMSTAFSWDYQKEFSLSVALTNPLMAYGGKPGNTNVLICGPEYKLPIARQNAIPTANFTNFVARCGSKQKMEILYLFREHGMLTAAQVARLIGVTPAMAWRYVEMLYSSKIITISRQEPKNIYYSLNPEYFRGLRRSFNEFMSYFDRK